MNILLENIKPSDLLKDPSFEEIVEDAQFKEFMTDLFIKSIKNSINPREIDLTPLFILACGNKKSIHRYIDEIYNKDRFKYYHLARKSPWYNHDLIKKAPLLTDIYAKKTLGLFLDNPTNVVPIIKKGWGFITSIIDKTKDDIDLKITEKWRKDNITTNEFFNMILIIYVYTSIIGKNIKKDDLYYITLDFFGKLISLPERIQILKWDNIPGEVKAQIVNFRKLLRKEYGLTETFDSISVNKWDFIEDYNQKFSILFDFYNMDTSFIEDAKISDKLLNEILTIAIGKDFKANPKDVLYFLIPALYIKHLIDVIMHMKTLYFKDNQDLVTLEIEDKIRTIQELKFKNEKLYQQNKILQEEIENARKKQKEISARYEAQIRNLKKELEQYKNIENELHALRNYVFATNNETISQEKTLINNYQELNQIKALVFGGHVRWQNKMRHLLPNWKFISPDNVNFSTQLFDNVELICVYPGYLNHAMYYKVINEVRKRNLKLYFINNTNESLAFTAFNIVNKV